MANVATGLHTKSLGTKLAMGNFGVAQEGHAVTQMAQANQRAALSKPKPVAAGMRQLPQASRPATQAPALKHAPTKKFKPFKPVALME